MKDCETGIQCVLEVLDTFYTVSISIVAEDKAITFTVSDSNGMTVGSATSKNVTIPLPRPQRTSLVFNQRVSVEKGSVGFSVRSQWYFRFSVLLCSVKCLVKSIID